MAGMAYTTSRETEAYACTDTRMVYRAGSRWGVGRYEPLARRFYEAGTIV